MLNIFGAFGRLLPGYMQGEQQAIKDNWYDLNQYNQVQAGQIQNAWDEATFNPRLTMVQHAVDMSDMGVQNAGMDYLVNLAALPGRLGSADVYSAFNPWAQRMAYEAQMQNPALFSNQLGQSVAWGLEPYRPVQQGNALNTPTAAQRR